MMRLPKTVKSGVAVTSITITLPRAKAYPEKRKRNPRYWGSCYWQFLSQSKTSLENTHNSWNSATRIVSGLRFRVSWS
ncbi:MAG: hypothetical protein OEV85_10730 [Candidatus Thorarchaeota archaeon]|nr:hypothetical protein [Candidatus Thorarchaeota archaeon]